MKSIKEIGGYFGLEQFGGTEYHSGLIGVNSGRAALLYVIRAKGIRKLYIPLFLCDSVYKVCEREGVPYEFYSVGEGFLPEFDGRLGEGEWLYVVNYYGQLDDSVILALKEEHKNLIIDNVQAFFRRPLSGVDTVYSCRKFFGVPDGGYVSTDAILDEELPEGRSSHRMRHVLGRIEDGASAHYGEFKVSDDGFAAEGLTAMSAVTRSILRGIDYEAVRLRRNENYAVLASVLGELNPLKLTDPDGPYCYPFYCHGGMEIKRRLAEARIFVPTLWPNVLSSEDSFAADYAANILPLPVDQRYGEAEMAAVAAELLRLIK